MNRNRCGSTSKRNRLPYRSESCASSDWPFDCGIVLLAPSHKFLFRLFEFCRERPPWRSVERKIARIRPLRNATEGVPYSLVPFVSELKQSN
jgi:hypothetical protein